VFNPSLSRVLWRWILTPILTPYPATNMNAGDPDKRLDWLTNADF